MGKRKLFTDLIQGQYIPGFDYVNTEFKFETVFERTAYTYRICACGYQHEYLSYISELGEIDSNIYEKIVQCIVDGICPHVDTNSRENSRTAKITGVHVAAAVGPVDVFKILQKEYTRLHKTNDPLFRFWDFLSLQRNEDNIFGIDPYVMAILKQNIDIAILPVMWNFTNLGTRMAGHLTLCGKQIGDGDSSFLLLEEIPVLEFIVRENNSKLLRNYLDLYGLNKTVVSAIHYTVANDCLDEIQDILLSNIEWYMKPENMYITNCILKFAVGFNQTSILEMILRKLVTGNKPKKHDVCRNLSKICFALKRNDCEVILLKYGYYCTAITEDMTEYESVKEIMNLLIEIDNHFLDAVHPRIMPWLCPDLPMTELSYDEEIMSTFLHKCQNKLKCGTTKSVLQLVLEFRSIVLQREDESVTPFRDCLNLYSELGCVCSNAYYRQAAEFLIYENSNYDHKESALIQAVNIDKRLHKLEMQSCYHFHFMKQFTASSVQVILDCKTHAILGHDDEQEFALNFMAPLLIEGGYTISKNVREHIESTMKELHSSERDYFERILNTPPSLKVRCRHSLRRYYKGKRIHYFVDHHNIPKSVREFILCKPLLKVLKL